MPDLFCIKCPGKREKENKSEYNVKPYKQVMEEEKDINNKSQRRNVLRVTRE